MDAEKILSSRAANVLLISTEYCCCNSTEVRTAEKSEIAFDCFHGVLKLILMLAVTIRSPESILALK